MSSVIYTILISLLIIFIVHRGFYHLKHYLTKEETEHVGPDSFHRFAGFHFFKTIDVAQEWTDVLQMALSFSWSHINWKLSAAELVPERGRWV